MSFVKLNSHLLIILFVLLGFAMNIHAKVLIMNEDHAALCSSKRVLAAAGFSVLTARARSELIEILTQQTIDVVLMDTCLPSAEVAELIRAINAQWPATQIIVATESASMADAKEAIRLGAYDYLVKPISADRLLETLNHVAKKAHTVLIVDDDPEMVRLLARMIRTRSRRYQVLRAYGGAAALAMLREHTPDIVILDLVMPDIDGYTVLREMRMVEALRDIPVVAVTARSYEAETFAAGALEITREGGLSVGELMACLKSSLDSITTRAGSDAAPIPVGVP